MIESQSPRPDTIAYLLIVAYLLEELVNREINGSFSGALAASALVIGARLTGRHFRMGRPQLRFGLALTSIAGASLIISPFLAQIPVSTRELLSMVLLALVVVAVATFPLQKMITDRRASTVFLLAVMGSVLLDYFGYRIYGGRGSAYSGFYSEPSHVAMHLIPVLGYRLFIDRRDVLVWGALLLTTVLVASTTMILAAIGVAVIALFSGRWRISRAVRLTFLGGCLIGVGSVLSLAVSDDLRQLAASRSVHHFERIASVLQPKDDGAPPRNLSALVYLNGWSSAHRHLTETDGFGVGFNLMGTGRFMTAGVYSEHLERVAFGVLNFNDGSFLAAKLIAEFGILGVGAVFLLGWIATRRILQFGRSNDRSPTPERLLLAAQAAGGLATLSLLFVRSHSYFALPNIVALSMLLDSRIAGVSPVPVQDDESHGKDACA